MKIMVRWNRMKIKGDITLYSLLRKLRSGFQILSHIEWVSAYGSHISTASVLGIVGLLLAVRDGRMGSFNFLSDKDNSSEKLCFIPGLRNLGNNCFLNVVLQSLASCSSFRHFLEEVEELKLSSRGACTEDLPVLVALVALLDDLSTLRVRSVTLNPHNVMSAMQHYLPQFQLTNEQDAAEAFLHLLSCLRDELSESYMPSCGSLADVASPPSRILPVKGTNNTNEPERWRQQYLGPFDGILQSFLSCRSCSSEIMMDFCFFHTLHLSLMGNTGSSFPDRFTLEDCIKRFLAPEHLENYSCSCCWHNSAIKYLSSVGGQQEEIRRLSSCIEQDSCDCRNISSLEALPWSNHFSHTFKQLSIAQCPQILCLHLQRTSMNMFGEPMKLQGHISFPLILNLSPFVKHEVGIQKQDMGKQRNLVEQHYLASLSHPRSITKNPYPAEVKDDASQVPEICSPLPEPSSASRLLHAQTQNKVMDGALNSKNYLYRLVSVVEHFGRAGSGHYTVYRGVKAQVEKDSEVGGIDIPLLPLQWFSISDSEVHHASEEDVLGAEASLLFYERI